MSPGEVVIEGTLTPEGTLQLDEKLKLSPGRVQVIVKPLPGASAPRPGLAEVLRKIQQDQKARGYVPRTKEEIDAELQELRDDAEAEMRATEQFHEECRQAREQADRNKEQAP